MNSKTEIQLGAFLPSRGETCFSTMDGSDVAAFLTRNGYKVAGYYDTGRNGLAVTECGLAVSTNGHVSRATRDQYMVARASDDERAERGAFADDLAQSQPASSVGMIQQMARVAKFEDEMAAKYPKPQVGT